MGQEKNACIEMLDTRYIEPLRTKVAAARTELEQFPERNRDANCKTVTDYAPVLEAYDRMKTAARAANPVFEKLLQRRREGGGLTLNHSVVKCRNMTRSDLLRCLTKRRRRSACVPGWHRAVPMPWIACGSNIPKAPSSR